MSKKLIYLISLVLALGAPGRVSGGLVAHWALDDGQGSTASDSSGNNHHGTIGGTANWIAGRVDGALDFDGSSTYIDMDDQVGSGTFTLAMWIKPRDIPYSSDYYAVLHNDPWDAGSVHVHLRNTSSLLNADINSGPGVTSTTVLQADEWYHCVLTVTTGASTLYINGVLESTGAGGSGTPYLGPLNFGAWNNNSRYYHGAMDDIRVYDRILLDAQVEDLFNGIPPAFTKAEAPDPPDGATGVISPLLTWQPGETAAFHNVYLGPNPELGPADLVTTPDWQHAMYWHVPGFTAGATYYWRVDEVEADGTTTHTGDVWSFTAAPVTAYDPDPPDGAKNVPTDKQLSWTPGATAFSHDVYFGTDETEVTNGTGGTFKVTQTTIGYDPETLAEDTRYYWRIDEVEQNLTTKHTGDVWSFRTMPEIVITDPDLMGWWKLDEGSGTTAIDWSGHDNHGELRGDPQWVVQGYDGGALDFDGAGDFVYTGKTAATLGVEGANPKTVTAWVYTRAFNNGGIWDLGTRSDGQNFCLRTMGGNNNWRVQYWGGDDHDFTYASLNEWVHFALVYTGAQSTAYANAVSISSEARTLNTSNANPFQIGCYGWQVDYFNGIIDDVRLYKKALTVNEIKKVMQGDPTLAWNPNPANGSTADIEHATSITWSPGEKAAKHDVYFSTDEDAVIDADTSDTTGVYRGRIDPNSYTPPEGVQVNQTYYWRIDQFNTDATISEGRVWSYTVADYLIIDDFEAYDDFCNRIFYAWPDGWGHNGDLACGVPPYGGNGTGSTVGYLAEPYAEQTIVHGGDQSMPMEYLNDGSTGKALYSETERTFEFPQDFTRKGMKSLTLWFRGLPGSVGSFSYDPVTDLYTLTATGTDIWNVPDFPGAGAGNYHDEFHYAYKQLSGVGSIQVQVLSVANTNTWAKAGVMIRETLDANSVHAMTVITPGQGVSFQRRPVTGQASENTALAGFQAPYWVRITRSGNDFTSEHSLDGTTWETIGTQNIPMASTVYVGLALTSHNAGATCEAQYSDLTVSGTVTGQWQSQDIGIASNDAEQLYVALEDSTGQVKAVPHPDPDAATLDTWQQWNIDLADFAPVDVTKVKKMYIGVGDRNLPKLGGAGMLYIDDIRLYQPRCVPSRAKSAVDFNSDCVISYPDLKILTNDWLFAPGASGLNYEYYQGDWDLLPDFDSLTTAVVGNVDNFDIGVRTQNDYFGFRFTGQIDIATAGDYTFYTESDDGSRLYIDGTLVVDNDGTHGMVEQSGTISLTAGLHPITVTMFEKGGGEGLNVQYEGPGITKEPVPNGVLYRQSSLVDLSGDGAVDFKDYALLADAFLDELLWP